MAKSPNQQNLFATPILLGKIEDEEMRSALEEAILARRSEHPGLNRSNTGGGWHSDVDLMRWGGESARKLLNQVLRLVARSTTDVKGVDGATLTWRVEAWANVNEKGGANARHVHGGCYWSVVYYVRVDEDTASDLVLFDPRMPTLAMHAPHLRFRNAGGEREMHIKPHAGLLVAFPSWLAHEVEPSKGKGLRISIAINLTANPSGRRQPALKAETGAAKAAAIAQPAKETT
ncbi:MAG: TIGR02466 family protein [Sphingomonadales bacterium]